MPEPLDELIDDYWRAAKRAAERRPMNPTHITAVCENGHQQTLKVDAALGEDWARNLAGLLDGSSPMYLAKPGPESVIGKCGICGTPITCTVQGFSENPDTQDRR